MAGSDTLARLARLEGLEARLRSGEPMTVAQLADEFAVSRRTLSRDIELLRERGVPVDADRGRGGGVRMARHWGTGRLQLGYREAVDLLISLAVTERMHSPLLLADLGSVRAKLVASFDPTLRDRARRLRARLLVGEPASAAVLGGYTPPPPRTVELLHDAFLSLRPLRMRYADVGRRRSERSIEPHYLLLSFPVWYVLAWDRLRADVRTFRCDRMRALEVIDAPFALLPRTRFKSALEGIEAGAP